MTTRSVDFPDGQTSDTTPIVGGATWGGIGGTLSAQTDLQAALDAKVGTAALTAGLATKQDVDADLTAVAGLSTTGLVARTGSGTASARTVTGTANQLTVTDGDGVSGNPTLSLPSSGLVLPGTAAVQVPAGTTAQRPSGVNSMFRYNSDTGNFEGYAAGAWGSIAGSGGGLNYISAPDGASIGAWVAFADAAGSAPVDGFGGSPASTFAVSTNSSLVGTTNFLWTKSANNRQGEGFSYAFSIDSGYQAKTFTLSFMYSIASGTYADGDMTCWLYDVTNGTLIQPSAYSILNAVGPNIQKCEFQTNSNSTSYRLIVHTSSTSALAYSLRFAQVSVSPGTSSTGSQKIPTIQKLTSSGTYTTPDGVKWLRVRAIGGGGGGGAGAAGTAGGTGGTTTFGSLISCVGGTGGNSDQGGVGGAATITAPAVGTAGTGGAGASVMVSGPTQSGPVFGGVGAPGWMGQGGGKAGSSSASATAATFYGAGGGGDGAGLANNQRGGGGGGAGGFAEAIVSGPSATYSYTIGAAGTAGGTLGGAGYIEVTEHYFNAVPASETDTRVVDFSSSGAGGAVTADVTNIPATTVKDSHGAWTGSTYVVRVAGDYIVLGGYQAPNISSVKVWIDGVNTQTVGTASAVGITTAISGLLTNLRAGQVVAFRSDISQTLTSVRFQLVRVSGPAQIAASEKVFLQYTGNAGGAQTAITTNVDFTTKVVDSHGAWSGSTFTAPRAGWYNLSGSYRTSAATANNVYLYIDTVLKFNMSTAVSTSALKNLSCGFYVNADQVVSLRTDGAETLLNSATTHWLAISSQG